MNLLKSKFFLGALVVVAFAFANVASAAFTYTGLLKMGMTHGSVVSLQQTLNMTSCKVGMVGTAGAPGFETTYFGAKTVTAVKCFQMAHGLTADGVVGPMTGAKLATVMDTTSTPGCPMGALYNSMTGAPCTGGTTTNFPAGCSSNAGFSTTTGLSCAGGTTPSTPNGTLGNGEGDIDNVSETSSDDSSVEEGSTGEIFAFDVEIDGDVMIDRVDIYMEVVDSTSGSEDADDYFASAILMVDGEEVAEVDVEDFSQEDYDSVTNGTTDDDEYRVRFSNLDLVFADGDEPEFALAMVGNNTIDSDDRDEEWTVSLETDSIRFTDG
jgi:peptidoglycan hydrolase-like protein with peptidoglycan-binding domain